jgi:LIVCS family branched-chain amino acid:cation transporter
MKSYRFIFVAGFAIFSMFFGAGNLIFPIMLGQKVGSSYFPSVVGLWLTGVLVPLLGLVVTLLFRCDCAAFFRPLGRRATWWICFLILSLMGPFGAGPRCINVSCGGVLTLFPWMSPIIFNFLFCVATVFCILSRDGFVALLGNWLSPILLVAIAVIIVAGWIHAPQLPVEALMSPMESLQLGIQTGYQTMDLLAAFFFATTIYIYLKSRLQDESLRSILSSCALSFLLGMGLLGLIYSGFVVLGAHYGEALSSVGGDQILIALARHAVGPSGVVTMVVLVNLACLTTLVAVTHLFAEFLRDSIRPVEISHTTAIGFILLVTYAVSLIGFGPLCQFLAFVMKFFYPALIAFLAGNVISRFCDFRWTAGCFYGTLIVVIVAELCF